MDKQRGGLIIAVLLVLALVLAGIGIVVLRQDGARDVETAVSDLPPATVTTQPTEPPTDVPEPTETAVSVAQPDLATAIPTAVPTDTPIPTDTPTPTNTPLPTDTPTPTNTPVPVTAVPTVPPTNTPVPVCVFNEQNGMVLIDVESSPAVGGWAFESGAGGYIGNGYYTWRGDNHLDTPGNGVLSYKFNLNSPGTYFVRIHNYHDHPDGSQNNDAWVRIPGVLGWVKTWSSEVSLWNWGNNFEMSPHNHREPFVEFSSAGEYTLQISGRSTGFSIDRILVVLRNQFTAATNQSLPQSPCR